MAEYPGSTVQNILIAFVCCSVVGCVSTNPRDSVVPERPLVPVTGQQSREFSQVLRARHNEVEIEMLAAGVISEGALHLAGLTAEGFSLFSLNYDNESLTMDQYAPLPHFLSARAILADMQLVYWAAPALLEHWEDGWQLEESQQRRTLLWEGRRLVEIDYPQAEPWHGMVRLEHLQLGYVLEITTVSTQVLP